MHMHVFPAVKIISQNRLNIMKLLLYSWIMYIEKDKCDLLSNECSKVSEYNDSVCDPLL